LDIRYIPSTQTDEACYIPAWTAAAAGLGRDGAAAATSDIGATDVTAPDVTLVSVADEYDAVADVTVMLTCELTADVVWVVVAAALVVVMVDRVELNEASSCLALLSSYEHVSRASSTTDRLLSGNSSISLFLTGRHTN